MIPTPKIPTGRMADEDAPATAEKGLDAKRAETGRGDDATIRRQWSEMEASERARAEREARLKDGPSDRVALYSRGPTAFSA